MSDCSLPPGQKNIHCATDTKTSTHPLSPRVRGSAASSSTVDFAESFETAMTTFVNKPMDVLLVCFSASI